VVSTLIRITGDWSLAEDCTADAFEKALARWDRDGVPDNPGAWLTTVAKNGALDKLRRAANETRKLEQIAIMNELELDEADVPDDRLRLIFTCCHPALALEARVALTLRTVAGLTTPEIAAAFLVPEPTMAQRLVRAKRKIANARIPYRVPPLELLPERLSGVLAVLYLLFNEGYSSLGRVDLAAEAIRLTRSLASLVPGEPEVLGLLALELLQHSRRAARSVDGELVPLEEQDRTLWDRAAIDEALGLLRDGGVYQLQAAIAAVHARDEGEYGSLVALYDRLVELGGGSVVALNRAVAIGMADGPAAGLAAVEALPASDYYLVPAARADFLRRLGRNAEAAAAYEFALERVRSEPERRYLERRLAEVADP
jgi:RNA polymerase sigma-70 factor (ECF subfamily)